MSNLVNELAGIGTTQTDLRERPRSTAPLMRDSKPVNEMRFEKPWHRTVAWLLAKGHTRLEIAQAVNKTPTTVALLAQQPYMRQLVADIIAECQMEDDSAINLLKAAQSSAAQTIVTLSSTATSETVKLNAAREILDRILGRPVQNINTHKSSSPMDPKKEQEELQAEIARLSSTTLVQINNNQTNNYGRD